MDGTWTAFVKHDQFWNLAHATQRIPDPTPIEPIRLITGLASGIADPNRNTMAATLNLGTVLDFNGNGIIDPNETLAPIGTATNAFVGILRTSRSLSFVARPHDVISAGWSDAPRAEF